MPVTGFEEAFGFSNGYLFKPKELSMKKIEKIRQKYPELNEDWIFFGRGEMILKDEENAPLVKEKNQEYKKITEDLINQLKLENENLKGQISFLQDVIRRMQEEK